MSEALSLYFVSLVPVGVTSSQGSETLVAQAI